MNCKTATICIPADKSKAVTVLDYGTDSLFVRKDGTPSSNFLATLDSGMHVMVWTSDDASLPSTYLPGVSHFGLSGAMVGITMYGDSYITSVNARFGNELGRLEIESILSLLQAVRSDTPT